MPLSRLENFLRSPKGTILYVDPNSFDATDSFENRGDSSARPFASLQRALVEAARFSYQPGLENDLNDRTTILVSPGTHYIDNRPGLSIDSSSGTAVYKKRTGKTQWTNNSLSEFNENSDFDIFSPTNVLHKFNSVEGGVILPRGTSIVGYDLRKTKIRPLYVPDPSDPDIDRSSIFKITGNCYFTAFTFFDADSSNAVYKDYTDELFIGNYSHHKLTAFTYADGVNKVKLGYQQTNLTDLQMYYYKIANAYGNTSGRDIPDYPSSIDIEPSIDEYRIVGVLDDKLVGISSIRAGDGLGGGYTREITVTTKNIVTNLDTPHNLKVNTPILISGISVDSNSYNGAFVVNSVINSTTFTYITSSVPVNKLPTNFISNAIVKVESDTTSSSSPYILNCSLRSNYGMCGLWADGSKADGFKSVVVAQFTGISLQRDDNAFLIYSEESKDYKTNSQLSSGSSKKPLHTNPYAIYNPDYENFHIKVSNNSFIQCVSIFAIGYAKHFVTESGGDMSITNSNSNFGALSLESSGFRDTSFDRDDAGFITHIIPPRTVPFIENTINWLSIDVALTQATSNDEDKRLYLYEYNNINKLPPFKIDGYRIGAKDSETLYVELEEGQVYSSPIVMEIPVTTSGKPSARKEYEVERENGENNIESNSTITFTENHKFITGEKVRVFSDNGQLPDGIENNTIYYAIRINSTKIKLAYNFNDAIAEIGINGVSNNGGILKVVSSVSDMKPGEPGHPIQWDSDVNNWYVNSKTGAENQIYNNIQSLDVESFGDSTLLTRFTRRIDTLSTEDRLYKVRYVIPKEYSIVREPTVGFVLQETKSVGITTRSVNRGTKLLVSDQRNEKIIKNTVASSISNNSQIVTLETERPHNFIVGDFIEVKNVKSTFNTSATGITSTFNGTYEVLSIPNSRKLTYRITGVSTNPGVFTNNVNTRTTSALSSLPTVSRNKFKNTFVVYNVDTIKKHIPGENGQDGIYHLTLLAANAKTNSSIGFGLSETSYNQDIRNLYPQIDRDNYNPDPEAASSYADHKILGRVITNNKKNSLTKETIQYFIQNNNLGFGITDVVVSGVGNTTITIFTEVEHKLRGIKRISNIYQSEIQSSFPNGAYYGIKVIKKSPEDDDNYSIETDALCNIFIGSNPSAPNGKNATIEFIDFGTDFLVNERIGFTTIGPGGQNNLFEGIYADVAEVTFPFRRGLELGGFDQPEFNDLFRIIGPEGSKSIVLESTKELPNYRTNNSHKKPFGIMVSDRTNIESGDFSDINSGIVTITTISPHNLFEGNSFKIVGTDYPNIYDSNFTVNEVIGINTFNFNIGIVTDNPPITKGNIYKTLLSPNEKSTGTTGENLGSRLNYIYAGISTYITSLTKEQQNISFDSTGFQRGDYVQINDEIIRLVQDNSLGNVSIKNWYIERAMFGTLKNDFQNVETRVNKIKIIPVELRRPSFLRASGHTFEYLGYGPGNYSTSVPQKQTRKLSGDEIVASQSRKLSGGTVVYSGMNDIGEFYYGAKKVSAITGEEVIVEAPVVSFVGDDADGSDDPSKVSGVFDSLLVRQKITVEGGDDQSETTTFNGPVSFNKKITINSDLEIPTLNLGKPSVRKIIGVGATTDFNTLGNGTIVLYPNKGNNITAVSTSIGAIKINDKWKRWGLISKNIDNWDVELDELKVNSNCTIEGNLTIKGNVSFGSQSLAQGKFDELEVDTLTVNKTSKFIGTCTFEDEIKGKDDNINFTSTLNIGTESSSKIKVGDGGLGISIGVNANYTNYGLRLERSSSNLNPESRIYHKGSNDLVIKALDSGGAISVATTQHSIRLGENINIEVSSTPTSIFKIEKNAPGSSGSGGAHLAIQNTATSLQGGDAVISWRGAGSNSRFWFAGVDYSDTNIGATGFTNSWKLGYSSQGTNINSQDFNNSNVYLGITSTGNVGIGTNPPRVKLHVEGNTILNGITTSGSIRIPSTSSDLTVGRNFARSTPTENKYEAVGNTFKLDVGGDGKFSGLVQCNSLFVGAGEIEGPVYAGLYSGDGVTGNVNLNTIEDDKNKIPTVEAVYDFTEKTYAKVNEIDTPYIVLHVAKNEQTTLSGEGSVPAGYFKAGLGYNPNSDSPFQSTLYPSVTDALEAASRTFVPYGAEIIISVHNNLSGNIPESTISGVSGIDNYPTTFERGPLMIGNGWSTVIVGGAKNAIDPRIAIGKTETKRVSERIPQYDLNLLSAGIIFQDINIDVKVDRLIPEGNENAANNSLNLGIGTTKSQFLVAGNGVGHHLTFNGGFAVSQRNVKVRWIDPGATNVMNLATASFGEKIQFRIIMDDFSNDFYQINSITGGLKDNSGNNLDLDRVIENKIVFSAKNLAKISSGGTSNRGLKINQLETAGISTTMTLGVLGLVGGLLGSGIDVIFDFTQNAISTGSVTTTNGVKRRKPAFGFSFNTELSSINFTNLRFLNIGSRGSCRIGSRVIPNIIWNFNNSYWNMEDFYTPFNRNYNICWESFGTVPLSYYGIVGITPDTADTIKTIDFYNGARISLGDGVSCGPFSLYKQLEGKTFGTGSNQVTIPNTLLTSSPNKDGWIYTN